VLNKRGSLRKIVTDAAKIDRTGIEFGFAVRCTVGVAIPLLITVANGSTLAGVSAAYGALVTGFASRQGVYRTRAIGMLLTAFALACSGFAGIMTGAHPVANVIVGALWAAAFGLIAAIGRAATVASVNSVVAFIIFSNPPYDLSDPWFQAAMVIAGGVLQTLLLVLVWPLQRFRTERHALAAAYRALARYADHVNVDDLGLPDSASLVEVRATLADPQPFGSRNELAVFEVLADEAERLRTSLAALTSDYHLLAEVGMTAAASAIGDVAVKASALLAALADAVDRGVEPLDPDARFAALARAVEAVEVALDAAAPSIRDARALAGQVRAAWRAGRAAANGGISGHERAPVTRFEADAMRDALNTLRANFSFDATYMRHAIRLAVIVAIAIVVQRFVPLAHAQWIGLTVALVLRPDFSSTFTRGLARISGTVGGAVIASGVAAFHPPPSAYVALAIVFAALSFALFNVSYAVFSAAITGYVVYLLAFGGSPEHAAAIDRVLATAIGGLLAFAAYVAWPTWARDHVAEDLALLLEAQSAFARHVLQAFLEPQHFDAGAMRAAQLASRLQRTNTEAAVDLMKSEPVSTRGISLATAQGILAASRRIGVASLTMGARIGDREDASRDVLARLIADFDTAMAIVVRSLRDVATPAPLPPLRDDQTALARAVAADPDAHWEVLASETDVLVDSADTIAELLRRR
jgi:uncharacterized membrane protein YccC